MRTVNSYAPAGWLDHTLVDAPSGIDVTLTFQHDALGRMVWATRQDGAGIPVRSQFGWDSLDNLVDENDDVLGDTARRTHRYDGAGQRILSAVGSRSASRSFDLLGRQTSLVVNGDSPATAAWTYGAAGGPLTRVLKNGVESRYGYDKLSRLASISDWRGSTRLAAYEWQLPLDGIPRRLAVEQGGAQVDNSAFAIDAAGRLTAEQAGTTASFQLGALDLPPAATQSALATMTQARTSYELDGRNNWMTRTSGAAMTSFARDARDALTAVGNDTVATDATGAITRDPTHGYTFDALGMLAEVQSHAGGGRLYRRDALGRIVTETDIETGAVTRFSWDGAQRVLARDPSGATTTTFAAEGLDAPVVTVFPNGERNYHHQDRQGSVYGLTNGAGQPARWISYNAYGEATHRDETGRALPPTSSLAGFGYHGLPHDFGLGLVDMRARTYRPAVGRFLSPDPIGLGGGSNLFAFVDSAPLAWRDPMGLAKEYANADGDGLSLVNGDAFLALNTANGRRYHTWNSLSGKWISLSDISYGRMLSDAYDWEAHPEKGRTHAALVRGLAIIPRLGRALCMVNPACRLSTAYVQLEQLRQQALECAPGDQQCVMEHLAASADMMQGGSLPPGKPLPSPGGVRRGGGGGGGPSTPSPSMPTSGAARGGGRASVKNLSTPAKYHVEDAADPNLWAIGEVRNGILELNIQTRHIARDGTVVRGALRGVEQFDSIVKHFEGQFTAIRGSWHAGDNLAHIARTGNPHTTWTGQQAARHGFGNATRGGYGFLPGTADGMGGGDYEWVEFLFRR